MEAAAGFAAHKRLFFWGVLRICRTPGSVAR
jgi:hypothetical protein